VTRTVLQRTYTKSKGHVNGMEVKALAKGRWGRLGRGGAIRDSLIQFRIVKQWQGKKKFREVGDDRGEKTGPLA